MVLAWFVFSFHALFLQKGYDWNRGWLFLWGATKHKEVLPKASEWGKRWGSHSRTLCPQATKCPLVTKRGALVHLLMKPGYWVNVLRLLWGVHFKMEVLADPSWLSDGFGFCNNWCTCWSSADFPHQKINCISTGLLLKFRESAPSLLKYRAEFQQIFNCFTAFCYQLKAIYTELNICIQKEYVSLFIIIKKL